MCSKPEAMLGKLLRRDSENAFYEAADVVVFAEVLAGRFRGTIYLWKRLLRESVQLHVDPKHIDTVEPCFVQVRDTFKRHQPKGYVSAATLAAHPARYKQVNVAPPKRQYVPDEHLMSASAVA